VHHQHFIIASKYFQFQEKLNSANSPRIDAVLLRLEMFFKHSTIDSIETKNKKEEYKAVPYIPLTNT
tara:strand:+ start:90 stop:290 length:201 start_codon:yes stop_codon:yes gene_type:complete